MAGPAPSCPYWRRSRSPPRVRRRGVQREEGRPADLACSEVGGTGGYSWRNQLPPQTNPKVTCKCSPVLGPDTAVLCRVTSKTITAGCEGAREMDRAGFYGHIVICWRSTAASVERRPWLSAPHPRHRQPLLFPCEVSFLSCEEKGFLSCRKRYSFTAKKVLSCIV